MTITTDVSIRINTGGGFKLVLHPNQKMVIEYCEKNKIPFIISKLMVLKLP